VGLTERPGFILIAASNRKWVPCAKGFAMPSVPRSHSRFVSLPLTRRAGALGAAAVVFLILLGCMSISIGKFGATPCCTEADGIVCQEGEVTVGAGELRQVFYPVPYVHPPNLEMTDTFHNCVLVHQQENSFTVRNDAAFSVTASWKARGVRTAPPPPEPTLLPPPAPVPAGEPPPAEATGKAG
jgi:hypothetical protein